jgi:hypothetical protein
MHIGEQALPPAARLTTAQRVRRLPFDRPEAGVAIFADHDVDMNHECPPHDGDNR